jgi:hypothetical protein
MHISDRMDCNKNYSFEEHENTIHRKYIDDMTAIASAIFILSKRRNEKRFK